MIKITITTLLFLLSFLTLAAHVEPVQTKTGEQEIIDIISGIKYGWENGEGQWKVVHTHSSGRDNLPKKEH
jgi:hypothetical protein